MNNKQQAVGQKGGSERSSQCHSEALGTDTLWCTVVHCLPLTGGGHKWKTPRPYSWGPRTQTQAWETSLLTGRSTALGGSISGFSAQKTTGPRFLILWVTRGHLTKSRALRMLLILIALIKSQNKSNLRQKLEPSFSAILTPGQSWPTYMPPLLNRPRADIANRSQHTFQPSINTPPSFFQHCTSATAIQPELASMSWIQLPNSDQNCVLLRRQSF